MCWTHSAVFSKADERFPHSNNDRTGANALRDVRHEIGVPQLECMRSVSPALAQHM